MLDTLSPEMLSVLSGPACFTFVAVLFAFGIIRPRSAIYEVREDRDARLADKDAQIADLKEAYKISEEARTNDREISREALEGMRTMEAAINGLRSALEQKERQT